MKQYIIGFVKEGATEPELCKVAKDTLETAAQLYNLRFRFVPIEIGQTALDMYGTPLPQVSIEIAKGCDALLLCFTNVEYDEKHPFCMASLSLKRELGAELSLVPIINFPQLSGHSPLKKGLLLPHVDMLFIFPVCDFSFCTKESADREIVFESQVVTKAQIKKAIETACTIALESGKRVTLVRSFAAGEWEKEADEILKSHKGVRLTRDSFVGVMREIAFCPTKPQIILAPPYQALQLLFLASSLCAADGALPAYCPGTPPVYGPMVHLAPYFLGHGMISPIGMILSVALFLERELGLGRAAARLRRAVSLALAQGYRTRDIMEKNCKEVSTFQMTDIICEIFRQPLRRRVSKG